jgi:hypothetical protein
VASDGDDDIVTKLGKLHSAYAYWASNAEMADTAARLDQRIAQVEQRAQQVQAAVAAEPDGQRQGRLYRAGVAELRQLLHLVGEDFGLPGFTWVPPVHRFTPISMRLYGRAESVSAQLCIDSWRAGSAASVDIPGITLRARYERGHLVARALGGPGDSTANLTPISKATNTNMRDFAEKMARENLDGRHPEFPTFDPTNVLNYSVTCEYPDPAAFDVWLTSRLGVGPGAWRDLFRLAQANTVERQDFNQSLGVTLSAADYAATRERLADAFLASRIVIRVSVVQGKAKVGPYYSVDNHM